MKPLILSLIALAALLPAQDRIASHVVDNGFIATSGGFATWLVALRDFDADGFEDYAVAAPNAPYPSGGGEVHLFSGRTAALLQVFSGDQSVSRFGHGIVGPGDINGDGARDLVVGAPHQDPVTTNEGRLRAFSGIDGSVLWTLDGSDFGAQLGDQLATVNDLNGDGVDEILAAEPSWGAGNRGRIRLVSGASGLVLGTVEGPVGRSGFGVELVAREGAAFAGDAAGRVYSVPLLSLFGVAPVEVFGLFPGHADKVDLALVANPVVGLDLVIGRRLADAPGAINCGLVELWAGGSPAGLPLLSLFGASLAEGVGARVAAGRDLDGDGVEEILFTSGGVGLAAARVRAVTRSGQIIEDEVVPAGSPEITSLADVSGDGRGELLVALLNGVSLASEVQLWSRGLETTSLQTTTGLSATLGLDLGPARAGDAWVAAYGLSGTRPGIVPAPGAPLLPIQIDAATTWVWMFVGQPGVPDALGALDASGTSSFGFAFPPAIVAALQGQTLSVAVATLSPVAVTAATNPVTFPIP